MIGYEWTVYAADSNDIVATGITDKAARAARLVEFTIRINDHAGRGTLAQVPVAREAIRQRPPDPWPAGVTWVCERDYAGVLTWNPLIPSIEINAEDCASERLSLLVRFRDQ